MSAGHVNIPEPEVDIAGLGKPTLAEASWFWLKLGFISFGGPAGQIAILHTELVERRRWVSEARFLHALNFCMLLPGPEAQQMATYMGWLLHGVRGGVIAGGLFVLPSALLLWALSYAYVLWGAVPAVKAAFAGMQPAVLGLVVAAAYQMGRRVLRTSSHVGICLGAFVVLQFKLISFPSLVALSGVLGWVLWRRELGGLGAPSQLAIEDPKFDSSERFRLSGAWVATGVGCLCLWWIPVVAAYGWLGPEHVVFKQGMFFSQTAVVTFGGAYAVLPYVAEQAVERHGWLNAGQMLDGLGLAESTPGPLIIVLQFVGFLGAWNHPGNLSAPVSATLGALITTWVTFLPSFFWIFGGAPFVERSRGLRWLVPVLAGITSAVCGVILSLATWSARRVLWNEGTWAPSWVWLVFAAAAFGSVRWRWPIYWMVLGSIAVGILARG